MPGDDPKAWKPEVVVGGTEALSEGDAFILAMTAIMAPRATLAEVFSEDDEDEPGEKVANLDYARVKARAISGDATLARDLRDAWYDNHYMDDDKVRAYVRHIVLRVNNDATFKFEGTSAPAVAWIDILKRILQFLDSPEKIRNTLGAFAADDSNPALRDAARVTLSKLSP